MADSLIVKAAEVVRAGGVLVYPTETLYALGGSGLSDEAAARVAAIKGRPTDKPLPLIIGSMDQLGLVTDLVSPDLERLARLFWPGPLSLLVPARPGLAASARDPEGRTSVRLTAHPLAQQIALAAGCPLVATSANRSGRPAAARPRELDPAVLAASDLAVLDEPWPGGGLPSTVASLAGPGRLRILRAGAFPAETLERAGFKVELG